MVVVRIRKIVDDGNDLWDVGNGSLLFIDIYFMGWGWFEGMWLVMDGGCGWCIM